MRFRLAVKVQHHNTVEFYRSILRVFRGAPPVAVVDKILIAEVLFRAECVRAIAAAFDECSEIALIIFSIKCKPVRYNEIINDIACKAARCIDEQKTRAHDVEYVLGIDQFKVGEPGEVLVEAFEDHDIEVDINEVAVAE